MRQEITANIVDSHIRALLGKNAADIPLMVHFPQGNGYVVYTSFHNEAQVTEDVQKILKHLAFEL